MKHDKGKRLKAATFTEAEASYLAEGFLGRLATASESGQPHVVPVAYRFDGTCIHFGGWNLSRSRKFAELAANPKVAIVVDDVVSTRPWRVRGVEVRGLARPYVDRDGETMVRIEPSEVRAWGLEETRR